MVCRHRWLRSRKRNIWPFHRSPVTGNKTSNVLIKSYGASMHYGCKTPSVSIQVGLSTMNGILSSLNNENANPLSPSHVHQDPVIHYLWCPSPLRAYSRKLECNPIDPEPTAIFTGDGTREHGGAWALCDGYVDESALCASYLPGREAYVLTMLVDKFGVSVMQSAALLVMLSISATSIALVTMNQTFELFHP